jgi:NAD(P)-dependent dehydrogenase (short-subunit alcohol dehydrogenase family)
MKKLVSNVTPTRSPPWGRTGAVPSAPLGLCIFGPHFLNNVRECVGVLPRDHAHEIEEARLLPDEEAVDGLCEAFTRPPFSLEPFVGGILESDRLTAHDVDLHMSIYRLFGIRDAGGTVNPPTALAGRVAEGGPGWSVKEKVCVVTGASGGIGKQVALGLARHGARVVIVSHSRERAEKAVDEIVHTSLNPLVNLVVSDLSVHEGVRAAATEIDRRYGHIHVLVNNSGLLIGKRRLTVDGIESTFALNHLGYFHLTRLLLDKIKASAPARIINTSSMAHHWGHVDWENLQGERRYSQWRAYSNSKLFNLLFTFELARRLEGSGVTANAVHPGFVRSGFGSTATAPTRVAIRLGWPGAISAEKGAATTLWAATSPDLSGVSGRYLARSAIAEPSLDARDEDVQRRLWEMSEKLTAD